MSFPPRPSPSIRYPSQGNLTAPTSLPQYPPMPYLQPGSSSSQPRILTSPVNRGPSYGNPNGKGPPPDGHRYFRLPGRGEEQPPRNPIHLHNGSPETMREEAKTAPKKRPRQSSTSQNPSQSDKTSPASPKAPPSVLVREKKQKACANCRRAKLKCIVESGDADCVRCRARKERCIFYPRSHVCLFSVIWSDS